MTAALLAALISVESGGRDLAVGDGGRAIGPLQIHAAVVEDVNRFAGTHYTHSGMTNRAAAMQVCVLYIEHYARGQSPEVQARIWNGGPKGALKKATIGYWAKVKKAMR